MSNPTKEQQTAIDASGKNIIVSAGAGSGKTFVLKERVLRILKSGISVDKLVILTFTKNAAQEMKDRIRKIILNNPEVSDQANLVDSAYITTFDSYSQSLVKKYNYLLNIDKNFGIIDSNIVDTEISNILDSIFERLYEEKNDNFNELINNYCYKNDDDLKKCIIKMYHSLSNIIGKDEYLNTYLTKYYSKEHIDSLANEYSEMVLSKRDGLSNLYEELMELTISEKAINENTNHINAVLSSTTVDELKDAFETTSLSAAYKGRYDEGYKPIKEKIGKIESSISYDLRYSLSDYIKQYNSTKISVSVIIDILIELNDKINEFKKLHNSYEFSDIAFKAIELVREHEDVRNEIKDSIHEIMIDEYQDTNDIQETFISYIQNNNVYMVGDVKQSIYRFRNANPYIFKNKYDNYSNVDDENAIGYRIDLTANFRSRGEVINNINDLFSLIMTDSVGGANYKKSHCMKHGNLSYDNLIEDNKDYNMEILSYPYDLPYNKVEVESFIMADDILKRINDKEMVVRENGKENILSPITYKDFCVLVDKSKNFDTIKKIFEYKGIPTTIYKDVSIKEDDEIYILKNLITLIIKIKDNNLDIEFKHAFMSILRSYIYKTSDDEILDIFVNNKFMDTSLYQCISKYSNIVDSLSNKEILISLIDEFDIINKLVSVGDIKDRSTKLEYFINTSESLNKFGMDIYSMNEYFDTVLNGDEDIQMGGKNGSSNAVKIMTIHGSKGLEFPIVYSPFLYSEFKPRKKDSYYHHNKYGFVLPFNDGMIENTFINSLYDYNELKENISEKLRLFYVNITRAREKFIMINSFNPDVLPIDNVLEEDILNSTSYSNMLEIIKNHINKYIKNIDVDKLGISRDYLDIKESNYLDKINKVDNKIVINNLNIPYKILERKHFSKALSKIIDKNFKEKLDFGTFMHYVFEVYDFKNEDANSNIDDIYLEKVHNFLKHDEVKNIKSAKCYKEHEIKFNKGESTYHGFIDLLIEYDDHFDIIDYKLSNINSDEYKVQLSGYKDYIESKYNKPTNIYLYSINKDIFKKLN